MGDALVLGVAGGGLAFCAYWIGYHTARRGMRAASPARRRPDVTYVYRRLDGTAVSVVADTVTFEPAHVAFWRDGRLVLAERNDNVHHLTQEQP